LGAVLALASALLLAASPASAARTLTVSIRSDGPTPAVLTATAGDTVVFRNDDPALPHQVRSTSANWAFDTGPLPPGGTATAGTLATPGEYRYGGGALDNFTGKVVVAGPVASVSAAPSPSRSASPAPSRPASAGPVAAPPASAVPSGSASASASASPVVPLTGVFPDLMVSGTPVPGGPAPAVAPVLPGATGTPSAVGTAVPAEPGSLSGPEGGRRYGLPAVLAGVAAAGVGSLLVRLLLAHPAARGRPRGRHAEDGRRGRHARPAGRGGDSGVRAD
jgi:plastocyanin